MLTDSPSKWRLAAVYTAYRTIEETVNTVVVKTTEPDEKYTSNTSIEGCVCCLFVRREEEKRAVALDRGWRIPKRRYTVNWRSLGALRRPLDPGFLSAPPHMKTSNTSIEGCMSSSPRWKTHRHWQAVAAVFLDQTDGIERVRVLKREITLR